MNKWERKLWFQKNKGKLIKRGTIALSVLLLVVGVIYITYSKFESNQEFTIINGKVVNNGDVQIISYEYDGEKKSVPPAQNSGYVIDEVNCTNANGTWNNETWKLEIGDITGKVKCELKFIQLDIYSITYNLNGGSCSNCPTNYNEKSSTFTLPTPTKSGETFTGWVGSNGATLQTSVTVPSGSTEDKSYVANWSTTNGLLIGEGSLDESISSNATLKVNNSTVASGSNIFGALRSVTSGSTVTFTMSGYGGTIRDHDIGRGYSERYLSGKNGFTFTMPSRYVYIILNYSNKWNVLYIDIYYGAIDPAGF